MVLRGLGQVSDASKGLEQGIRGLCLCGLCGVRRLELPFSLVDAFKQGLENVFADGRMPSATAKAEGVVVVWLWVGAVKEGDVFDACGACD